MQQEEFCPDATQMIEDVLRQIHIAKVIAYLRKTGWTVSANSFSWQDGWSLQPGIAEPAPWIYTKPDPEAMDNRPYRVVVPGQEDARGYLRGLQEALERLATVEQITFVTVACRILEVDQIVLRAGKDSNGTVSQRWR